MENKVSLMKKISEKQSKRKSTLSNENQELRISILVKMGEKAEITQEFETQEETKLMRQILEGQLMKYTNVMKGWQYRWFVLNPDAGTLEYSVPESDKRQRVRGSVYLAGAVISPSDEDSQTFTVNSASGDVYKLRAADARERQHWVNRLRASAEFHTQTIAQWQIQAGFQKPNNPPLPPREHRSPSFGRTSPGLTSARINAQDAARASRNAAKLSNFKAGMDPFIMVKDILVQVGDQQFHLARNIESLPESASSLSCVDPDLLLLKATSQATILCLEQCLEILQQLQVCKNNSNCNLLINSSYSNFDWLEPKTKGSHSRSDSCKSNIPKTESQLSIVSGNSPTTDEEGVHLNAEDELSDTEDYNDQDLGTVEEHKSVILHLLSQLKLGMDLTRVVLPTFILERRSLLEMFADFMSHADMFLKIPDGSTSEERMLSVLKWYLTSFHAGRKGSIAKKPYNPIIGETFHCSWNVSKKMCQQGDTSGSVSSLTEYKNDDSYRVKFVAEQVSHHPPVSAFYVECPEKEICMNAHVWTKSKFMGMSIGVNMIGEVVLYLSSHLEEYVFSLPSAFARSILTVPWTELGGRVNINCVKTGYSSSIMFHTKPFYGGKLHHITAEVKNTTAASSVCKVIGEWNGSMEFTYANGSTEVIDTNKLSIIKKRVRPVNKQGALESRRLWQQTTKALKFGDLNSATEYKKFLEDKQRAEEKRRQEGNISYPTKYFHREGESWIFNWFRKSTRGS